MDITQGFGIEDPCVFIPWGVGEDALLDLFAPRSLQRVTDGYYTLECVSLGGRRHQLGLHLRPDHGGVLHELEFWRTDGDLPENYADWQRALEDAFGSPHTTSPGTEGYSRHEWQFGRIDVTHGVFCHFGPAELVTIADRRVGE